ncbi:PREDICTED: uncharacterized protein LOC108554143 [Eufriesea mexicana]|uniref:uncharacterized protein LOC108554143 n=1 Tax=Eufriesea mexicana TaxID=516756 RepID=UPI00083C4BBA|nr:PREDICTED: uncharacterized protein LOC108554143 [Eufriesea mexicana]
MELDENSTEEKDSDSDLKEEDLHDEWQEINEGDAATSECWEEEELLIDDIDCDDPVSLYKLFVIDYILAIIIEGTNKYATQCMNNSAPSSRGHQQAWTPVTKEEMNTFIGILLIMSIVRLPEINSILKYLHFSDNSIITTENRLYKLRNIVDAIYFI